MKRIVLTATVACLFQINANAQLNIGSEMESASVRYSRPPVDSNSFGEWPTLQCTVSNYGKYLFSFAHKYDKVSLFANMTIKNLVDNKKTYESRLNIKFFPKFSENGKHLFYLSGKDSLCLLNLKDFSQRWVPGVNSVTLIGSENKQLLIYKSGSIENQIHIINPDNKMEKTISSISSFQTISTDKNDWLAYCNESTPSQLHLLNLKNWRELQFNNVATYSFSPGKRILIIKTKNRQLNWVNLSTGLQKGIDSSISDNVDFIFDKAENQLAFVNQAGNSKLIVTFNELSGSTIKIPQDSVLRLKLGKATIKRLQFNKDGTNLLCQYSVNNENVPVQKNVVIWNYLDAQLPHEPVFDPNFWASLSIATQKVATLNSKGEDLIFSRESDHYILLRSQRSIDNYYNNAHFSSLSLVDVRTGEKNQLVDNVLKTPIFSISPKEKFVIWFETDSLSWFSYEIATKIKRNISKSIPSHLYDDYQAQIGGKSVMFPIAGWGPEDAQIYLYDQFDIWKADPKGLAQPVNVTRGIGRKENVTLGIVNFDKKNEPVKLIQNGDELVLSAYNPETMESGFWKLKATFDRAPEKGEMQPYALFNERTGFSNGYENPPSGNITRIRGTKSYLVTRQSAEEYPNYFMTSDFKSYMRLTDFNPQRKYNWLTADLMKWQTDQGKRLKGILYKPENFDPQKKYPLIFTYYEQLSGSFHQFLNVDYSRDRLNIAYYVSNGYLVFVPDIYYKQGHNSNSAVNSLVSAVKFLSKLPYVDTTKLGIQGHSFGGFETNSLVVGTRHLFAAACEAAGVSDQISRYHQTDYGDRLVSQVHYEMGSQGSHYGIGVTPSSHPELYIENSPVLFVNQVTTPLLIMHGDKDGLVPFRQGVEMFLALKRANKPVWLMEYPNGGHSLAFDDQKDYTIRMKQFFDHYLKGAPMPKWMTQGLDVFGNKPNVGYELDNNKDK